MPSPEVQVQALPFLRIMFVTSIGMLIFFMLSGALRSAGDARTPMVMGFVLTGLNVVFNVVLIRGLGPIPQLGTAGAAIGTALASGLVAAYAILRLWRGGWVVRFPHRHGFAPDWDIIRALFRFGLPAGFQGIVMNIGGVFLLSFIGSLAESAPAQAAYSVAYTQLFSFVTWTSIGLMGAAAAVAGQNLGAGRPDRDGRRGPRVGPDRRRRGDLRRHPLPVDSPAAAGDLRAAGARGRHDRDGAAPGAERLGAVHRRRAHLHRRTPGHRATPRARCTSRSLRRWRCRWGSAS